MCFFNESNDALYRIISNRLSSYPRISSLLFGWRNWLAYSVGVVGVAGWRGWLFGLIAVSVIQWCGRSAYVIRVLGRCEWSVGLVILRGRLA